MRMPLWVALLATPRSTRAMRRRRRDFSGICTVFWRATASCGS